MFQLTWIGRKIVDGRKFNRVSLSTLVFRMGRRESQALSVMRPFTLTATLSGYQASSDRDFIIHIYIYIYKCERMF